MLEYTRRVVEGYLLETMRTHPGLSIEKTVRETSERMWYQGKYHSVFLTNRVLRDMIEDGEVQFLNGSPYPIKNTSKLYKKTLLKLAEEGMYTPEELVDIVETEIRKRGQHTSREGIEAVLDIMLGRGR